MTQNRHRIFHKKTAALPKVAVFFCLNDRYRQSGAEVTIRSRRSGERWSRPRPSPLTISNRATSAVATGRANRNFWRSDGRSHLLAVSNFTPVVRHGYRIGVPQAGRWAEKLNTDALDYGGSGQGNEGGVRAAPVPWHGQFHSLNLTLPPLGVLALRWRG